MTLITSSTNAEDLSMTMVAEFDAAPERLWNLWEDPRQLERWWGPAPYPATFTRYEFEPGGQCRYCMTGPEDFEHYGWWRMDAIDAPHRIEFADGLVGDDGEPVPGLEQIERRRDVRAASAHGTRMTVLTQFADTEQMEQMIAVGMEQGMRRDRPDRRPARSPSTPPDHGHGLTGPEDVRLARRLRRSARREHRLGRRGPLRGRRRLDRRDA